MDGCVSCVCLLSFTLSRIAQKLAQDISILAQVKREKLLLSDSTSSLSATRDRTRQSSLILEDTCWISSVEREKESGVPFDTSILKQVHFYVQI